MVDETMTFPLYQIIVLIQQVISLTTALHVS